MTKKSTVTGAKDIAKRFKYAVPGLVPAIAEAQKKALKPMLAMAKANAPIDDGDLRRSLAIKRLRSARERPQHAVGPRSDYVGKDGEKPVRIAHITEFGRAANADGHGEVQGTRWLTRAFQATAEQTIQIFTATVKPAFERKLAKLAARKAAK
ncbi:MAG TPA: HK97 gp10 family phage protein [Devosia sp.]|nr:HK97 gp10 family phage protein [Devosia sp.]